MKKIPKQSTRNKSGSITIPGAIIIAAALIAIALIVVFRPASSPQAQGPSNQANILANQGPAINMRAVTANDHILGNPNAPIKIVEYSDPSCPYCKMFAPTIEKIVANYGESGKVAWVYRSFPLNIHPNAGHESQAFECAASLGGNAKYWVFLKRLYEITPSVTSQSPTGLDQNQLPVIAKYAGLDVTAFNDCLSSGKFASRVEADYTDGVNAGVNGTPFNILVLSKPAPASIEQVLTSTILKYGLNESMLYISSDKMRIAMSGALPYETFQTIIDAIKN